MIAAPRQATVADGAAPGTAAAPADQAAAPFDSVLAIETLAATPSQAGLEGVAAELLSEAGATEDSDDTDSEDSDLDALEFLSALLMGPVVPRVDPARAGLEPGDAPRSPGASAAHQAETSARAPGAPPMPAQSALTQAAMAELAAGSGAAGDAAGNTLDMNALTATLDEGAADTDALSARGLDLLSQAARQVAATERPEIATSMRHPRWAEEFATRMTSLVRAGESQASLQLSPVELGPMDVNITVKDSQASIHFGAAHAETRALIEASLPKLREMLAAQGFNLMDASVSQGFARQSRSDTHSASGVPGEPEAEVRATSSIAVNGLLDLYA